MARLLNTAAGQAGLRRVGAIDHGGPPSHLELCPPGEVYRHAARVLDGRGHPCQKVHAADRYGLIYTDPDGRVMTAWVKRIEIKKVGGRVVEQTLIAVEPGVPAFPTSAVTGEMGAV